MVNFLVAILSATFLSGSFAPLNWWFLLPVAIALFLYAVTKTRKPFLISFIFASVFNFLTLKWSGTYVGIFPVLLLVILQSIFYLPLGFISYKLDRYSRIWLAIPLILLADELRSNFPFGGFGWNRLAFSQADAPYSHAAFFLGDSALTFIAVGLGVALYLLIARAQLLSVSIMITITTLVVIMPTSALNQGSANILGIQGNVPRLGLDFNSQAEEVFEYHLKQTYKSLENVNVKPDLVIWPENSVDVDPFKNPKIGQQISELAMQQKVPVIVGAVLKGARGPENASILWNEQGVVASKYVKRSLTPFGEYIPLRFLAKRVSPLANQIEDFIPGNRLVTHHISDISVAPIICYEVISDSQVRSITENSNLIVVQTNNATFANSGQSLQQLNITRVRAIESNRWIVSVSTTGVSAIIDNNGKIVQLTEQNVPATVSGKVFLNSKTSVANKLGEWTFLISFVISILIYADKRRKRG